MSDEIDIQCYLAALRRRWWLVLLIPVLALAISLGLSASQSRRYQATATLLAQAPRYQWRFDASILPVVDVRRDYQREFLAISRSNQIANRAAGALQTSGNLPDVAPTDLLAAINVRSAEGSVLLVTATANTPADAAAIANAWANALVETIDELYGVKVELTNYQAELEAAAAQVADLEAALADARTDIGLYSDQEGDAFNAQQRQIVQKSQLLAEYQNGLDTLNYLNELINAADPDANLATLPWEMLSGAILAERPALSGATFEEALADREQVQALLRQEISALEPTIDHLSGEITALQREVAEGWNTLGVINRQLVLARETYNTLSRKVDEASIQNRIDAGQLILVGDALPPASPVQSRRLAQMAVAAVLGLILGVIAALWLDAARKRDV